MNILVTGGAGFIGSHVADAFLHDGHEVAVFDSCESGTRQNVNPGARFFEGDIRDAEAMRRAFQEFRPDAVAHYAAQISVPRSTEAPTYDAQANIVGSLNVWEAAREVGCQRFVFASSGGAIYGHATQIPTPETYLPAPLSPYGLSKWVFEQYLSLLRNFDGPTPVMLRYANAYGPRQGSQGEAGVVAIFVRRLLEGLPCTIYGDGSMTRDFVFVGDVVEANRRAISRGDGGAFNIGTGQQTSTLELFRLCHSLCGGPGEPHFAPERPAEVRHSCLDASLAARELGWTPQTPLAEGLRQVVESVRS